MKSLNNVWIAFKTTPPALIVIGIAALVYLVAKIWIFDAMPEIFNHAYELGRLVQNLLEATLAAFWFFVLSFQLPVVLEQQRVGPAIYSLVDRVVGRILVAFDRVYRGRPNHPVPSDLPLRNVTLDLIKGVFESISPSGDCVSLFDPETLRAAQWMRSLTLADEECREYIAQIWRYGRFLDAEVAALLSEIESSAYSRALRVIAGNNVPIGNANLGFLSEDYFSIFQIAMRLAKRAEKMRKRYGIVSR